MYSVLSCRAYDIYVYIDAVLFELYSVLSCRAYDVYVYIDAVLFELYITLSRRVGPIGYTLSLSLSHGLSV